MYNPVEIIIKKRAGQELSESEINFMVGGYVQGKIPDYQMSSFLMAIFFRGMNDAETFLLTKSYIDSGKKLEFAENTVDKHSTGGVGDKVSIVLAPIVAACGGKIPMLGGRGLGHTGGTLDKLESIPNLRTDLDEAQFRKTIAACGFSIASQTQDMVPADKKIYALRDVSGTVESLPLITASIMSKKIAEGAKNLVIDLKVGSGAFMKNIEDARKLGRNLKKVGETFGQKVKIVYTDMNNPIGTHIGNGLEIKECVEYLQGASYPDLHEITKTLATQMLLLCDLAKDEHDAQQKIQKAIKSGKALEHLRQFIKLQNGNEKVADEPNLLPQAKIQVPILATKSGYIHAIDSQAIGYALIELKAGRQKLTDLLDYGTGAKFTAKIGDEVSKNQELGAVYCQNQNDGKIVAEKIAKSLQIQTDKTAKRQLILAVE